MLYSVVNATIGGELWAEMDWDFLGLIADIVVVFSYGVIVLFCFVNSWIQRSVPYLIWRNVSKLFTFLFCGAHYLLMATHAPPDWVNAEAILVALFGVNEAIANNPFTAKKLSAIYASRDNLVRECLAENEALKLKIVKNEEIIEKRHKELESLKQNLLAKIDRELEGEL
jgi:hypothetical protein